MHDLRSPHGWRIVASVYLDHQQDEASAHVRFFDPDGKLLATQGALELMEPLEIGEFEGGADETVAFTSEEEHAYNDQTELWYVPTRGEPKLVLAIPGAFERFTPDGVVIARQTYDGVHAETKGIVDDFYTWDHRSQTMVSSNTPRYGLRQGLKSEYCAKSLSFRGLDGPNLLGLLASQGGPIHEVAWRRVVFVPAATIRGSNRPSGNPAAPAT